MAKSAFDRALSERLTGASDRRTWLFVPYDQLSADIGPLSRLDPNEVGIVVVENPEKADRRPYHKQKLALVLANMRHFALEQAERGVAVRHVVRKAPYAATLEELARELGPLTLMTPAERDLRVDVAPAVASGAVTLVAHEGWLTATEDFHASQSGPPWRMDAFYKHVRRKSGVLMDGGEPAGGRFSFDTENRKPWKGTPPAPVPPTFRPDAVTLEVAEIVARDAADHPGTLDFTSLPATAADAQTLLSWALSECLPHFGPFEDAMSTRSSGLFHTRLSPLVNLHRITPARLLAEVLALPIDIASQEGFVRQLLGWREFVRHVHEATDGFRRLPGQPVSPADAPAAPSHLGADRPLPPVFWGGADSGLACLDRVVKDVWREGWSHHITRLMVLSNLATLLDVSPRALTDWFWVAYTDAFDWVVEPNVLGMGTFAAGGLMTTKPYVAGAPYIDRMSDYCRGCRFDPKSTCPVTPLYWAFLERHREKLAATGRLTMPLAASAKRTESLKGRDRALFRVVGEALAAGRVVGVEVVSP
jgi:deoxyribodipyrimidine photolyase-related protein